MLLAHWVSGLPRLSGGARGADELVGQMPGFLSDLATVPEEGECGGAFDDQDEPQRELCGIACGGFFSELLKFVAIPRLVLVGAGCGLGSSCL